ncbi:uncharacterized protein TNCV_2764481 [Trichonephila clavipes]|nr:uncharacterized protein TNCV_2764481 [Trichonephila clavipes]
MFYQKCTFSGSENVTEFSGGIDYEIKLLEIPRYLSCAYLKGHLLGRAQDWYQILGSELVQNTDTDFSQLKAALSKAFPAIQNRKYLETRFYASQQRQNQEPTDFVYDLLKLNKKLELGMSEKAMIDHIFVRLKPQVQDFVEVRNPQNTVQLLEVLSKFEKRYSCKVTRCLRNSDKKFQQAIDIILKPVIEKFVNVYIDDVIISSPLFTQHIEHLKEVFRLYCKMQD